MMDMIGKLLGLDVNSAVPVNPVRASPKKPRKELRFSRIRNRWIFPLAQIIHGVLTILDYINNLDAEKAKLRITKALLRISQASLTIRDRTPKKKK